MIILLHPPGSVLHFFSTQVMFKRATAYTKVVWRRLNATPAVKLPTVRKIVDSKAVSKFPWIQRYKYSSALTNLYDAFRLRNTFDYLCGMVGGCTFTDSMSRKLVAEGEDAFTTATSVLLNQSDNEDRRKSVDKKLRYFYENGFLKHLPNGKRRCTYILHSVDRTRITDMKLLVNAQRGVKLPEHDFVTRSYGLFCFLDDSKINSANPLKLRQHIEELLDNYSVCTVQVKINLDCTETFLIANWASGSVVQGSMRPRKVTHQVVLENCIDGQTRTLGKHWVVVDIDDWLQGNKFWE